MKFKYHSLRIKIILAFLLSQNIFPETVSTKSYILTEVKEGKYIAEKNSKNQLSIASISKLFTAFYSIQKNSLNLEIPILSSSLHESKINPKAAKFKIGEVFTLNEIIHAMLMTSSNIASVSLSSKLNGNERKFTEAGNIFFAKEGFSKTHLDDSHGLSEKTKSTAEEILKLLNLIYEEKKIYEILKKKEFILSNEMNTQRIQTTVEMTEYKGFTIFGKTGSTKKAGKCFAGFLEKDGKIYAVVLLNSENIYLDIQLLIDEIQFARSSKRKSTFINFSNCFQGIFTSVEESA